MVVSHTWLCTWASACSFDYGLGDSLLTFQLLSLFISPGPRSQIVALLIIWHTNLSSTLALSLTQAACFLFLQVWHYSAELLPTPQWYNGVFAYQSGCIKNGLYFCTLKNCTCSILCNCTHGTYYVFGTGIGSGDTAMKKADKNPCPHGTYSVAMTNPITSTIWHGSYKTILVLYLANDLHLHVSFNVFASCSFSFSSKLNFYQDRPKDGWLIPGMSQKPPPEHTCWSKKIENNQMSHLISHSHMENVILFVMHRLAPGLKPELQWTYSMPPFSRRANQCHLRLIFLYS